ncbi:LysR family transcriptional regulator [Nocardia sp. CA-119907]|uniref:LysR family transcriptional regulator n=1 Tax=Nocardia sp. CA-119907 TaxID=3239973 RepID=UPI003D999C73
MTTRPDLNLLVALQALLEEQHVSRAAQRIGVTQPAASAMLSRLRRHFGDQLLERVGSRYVLTPLGVELRDQAGGVLQLSDRLFATKSRFDPASSDRVFSLIVSDYMAAVLGPRLLTALKSQAPQAILRFQQFIPSDSARAESMPQTVDGLIAPRGSLPPGLAGLTLCADEWVAIVDRDNPIADTPPEPAELGDLPWVFGQFEPHDSPFMLRRLSEQGLQLRPHAVIDSFVALPLYIAGTDRIAIVQRRLTTAMPLPPNLRVIPCPFDAGPINEALWWHPVHTHDSGHQWFRSLVRDVSAELRDDGDGAHAIVTDQE